MKFHNFKFLLSDYPAEFDEKNYFVLEIFIEF